MEKKEKTINYVLGVLLLFSFVFLVGQNMSVMTGYATSGTTTSNVTISKYLAIAFSDDLSSGIQFGTVNTLPATNVNATENYGGGSSETLYYINVSNDGNTPIDICIGANDPLTSSALDVIGVGNETYANSTSTTSTIPLVGNEVALTESYVKSGDAVAVGSQNYYRFWLDIPAIQPSGDYNNTLSFKGVSTGLACGAI
jgi:hypothetical protein